MDTSSAIGAESSYTVININDMHNIEEVKKMQLKGEQPDFFIEKEAQKREIVINIYMTFDDGPQINGSKETMTEQILQTLKSNGIKATFFVTHQFEYRNISSSELIAANINNKRSLRSKDPSTNYSTKYYIFRDKVIRKLNSGYFKKYLRQIKNAGHAIGIHSYSHKFTHIYENTENFMQDFRAIYETIEFTLGKCNTQLYRFPGGSGTCPKGIFNDIYDDEKGINIDGKNYCFYDWDIDSYDSKRETYKNNEGKRKSPNDVAKTIENKVMNEIVAKVNAGQNDIIILFHDLDDKIGNNVAVDSIIKKLRNPDNIKGLSEKMRYVFEFKMLTYGGYTSQKNLRFLRQVYSDWIF